MWWLSIIDAAIGGIGNIIGNIFAHDAANKQHGLGEAQLQHSREVNAQNLAFQQDVFNWTKGQQDLMHQREDTAVQRRVADLQAAGLSPILAAGSAAQTHQPVQAHAPQRGLDDYSGKMQAAAMKAQLAGMYLGMIRQVSDIAHTNAETERIRDLIKTQAADRSLALKDYELRQMGYGLDERRVEILAGQLGVSEGHLRNEGLRLLQEQERINNDVQRVFNDSERLILERNALELNRLMNEAQRGLITHQTFSEELRQFGIQIDTERKVIEYKQLVYDFTLMQNLGYPTHVNFSMADRANFARDNAAVDAINKAERFTENYLLNSNVRANFIRKVGDITNRQIRSQVPYNIMP